MYYINNVLLSFGQSRVNNFCYSRPSLTWMETIRHSDLEAPIPVIWHCEDRALFLTLFLTENKSVRLPWDNSQAQWPITSPGKCELLQHWMAAVKRYSSVEELLMYPSDSFLSTVGWSPPSVTCFLSLK